MHTGVAFIEYYGKLSMNIHEFDDLMFSNTI